MNVEIYINHFFIIAIKSFKISAENINCIREMIKIVYILS